MWITIPNKGAYCEKNSALDKVEDQFSHHHFEKYSYD